MNPDTRRLAPSLNSGLDWLQRIASVAVPAVVLTVLTLYAVAGFVDRSLAEGQDYVLLFHAFGEEPWRWLTVALLVGLGYTALLIALAWIVKRWTNVGVAEARRGRLTRAVDWTLSSWWRVALVLMVAWAPLYVMQAPGTSNADLVMQTLEVLGNRAEMDYPPFDVYPIGYYLIPSDDALLSNHHNVALTVLYGSTLGVSMELFGTFKPGLLALTSSQALFTLAAFGRGMTLVARWVPSPNLRMASLIVLILSGLPVALWSIAIAKSPLFAAAFVWWLGISVDFALRRIPLRARHVAEWALVTLLVLASAKFAVYIVVAQIIVLALIRRGRRPWFEIVAAMAIPLVLFELALRGLFAAGLVIPGDPLAGRGLQIQTTALALRESPDALSDEAAAALDDVFDIEVMTNDFNQWTMAPIRGAGYRDGAYRWRTVTQEDVARFADVWTELVRNEPLLVLDGVVLKSFRFFDPLSDGRDNRPGIHADDAISNVFINGERLTDDGTNDFLREQMDAFTLLIMRTPGLSLALESSVRVVLVILMALVGILLRRPAVWVWATPLALHCGVLILAPLSSSGRYALGITYALPLVILALGVHRSRRGAGRSPARSDPETPQESLR